MSLNDQQEMKSYTLNLTECKVPKDADKSNVKICSRMHFSNGKYSEISRKFRMFIISDSLSLVQFDGTVTMVYVII